MPAFLPLAAALAPVAIEGAQKLFGRKRTDPADASRRTLQDLLFERLEGDPTEDPTIQASLAQLDRITDRRAEHDQSRAVQLGAAGGELEIAQAANRANSHTDALLGITGQAGQQRNAALSQALQGQQLVDVDQRRRDAKRGQLFSLVGDAARAYATAAAGRTED